MVDDSPPSQAVVRGCGYGGVYDVLTDSYHQRSDAGVALCVQPGSEFADVESGVWRLEWQLARWVADGSGIPGALAGPVGLTE